MKVNDLVKTIGYTRNRLDHFVFNLYEPYEDNWITIRNATVDDYIYLCDRSVQEWAIESEVMSIIIYMKDKDKENFKEYI